MDFIDLKTQYRRIKPAVDARIARVLEHGACVMGPEITELEHVLADYCGTRHCVISLPMHPYPNEAGQVKVVSALRGSVAT